MCDNNSIITAYGNDNGYESIFVEQLINLMNEGDLVFAISASRNSPNVVKAVEYAKEKKGIIVSLTGFKGGKLKLLSHYNIHVPSDDYEPIEDIHMVIGHMIVYCFKKAYGTK